MLKQITNRNLTTFARVVLLVAFYFVGGLAGKETTFLSGSVALGWPPAGIALAATLLLGYQFWSGVANISDVVWISGVKAPTLLAAWNPWAKWERFRSPKLSIKSWHTNISLTQSTASTPMTRRPVRMLAGLTGRVWRNGGGPIAGSVQPGIKN